MLEQMITFKVKVTDNVNGEKILNKANVVEGNNNYDTNETTNPTSTKPVKDVFSASDDKVILVLLLLHFRLYLLYHQ